MSDKAGSGSALAGLIGHYGSDSSGDESGNEASTNALHKINPREAIWSMCVDPATGHPYYWEQITNQVSWEPPLGFIATPRSAVNTSMNLNASSLGQMWTSSRTKSKNSNYVARIPSYAAEPTKVIKKPEPPSSDEEEEKIELITSYYNSDSGSGEENIDDASPKSNNSSIKTNNIKSKLYKKESKTKQRKNISSTTTPYGPELPDEFKKSAIIDKPILVVPNTIEKPTVQTDSPLKIDSSEIDDNVKLKTNVPLINQCDNLPPAEEIIKTDAQENSEEKETNNASSPSSILIDDKDDKVSNDNIIQKDVNPENVSEANNKPSTVIETDNLEELIQTQATLLKKLGELDQNEIKYLNGSSENSPAARSPIGSPVVTINSPVAVKKTAALEMDVDDLIAQIEMEQPIDQSLVSDTLSIETQDESLKNKFSAVSEDSSEQEANNTFKPLFPSSTFMKPEGDSHQNIENIGKDAEKIAHIVDPNIKSDEKIETEKNIINKYETLINNEGSELNVFKRKRRIALDVLPVKKHIGDLNANREVSYTTKYAQGLDASGERLGLGFKSDPVKDESESNDSAIKYQNFVKGDTLVFQKKGAIAAGNSVNEEENISPKNGENNIEMDEQKDLIEAKLKFLVQSLPPVPPVQQLFIELQTLWGALTSGALQSKHVREWLHTADSTLDRLEASAAPHPWICRFHSGAGCYVYEHADTGQWQWEYPGQEVPPPPPTPPLVKPPAPPSPPPDEPTDMDISTTPPPQLPPDIRSHYTENSEPLPPGVETPVSTPPPLPVEICSALHPPPPPPSLDLLMESAGLKIGETRTDVPVSDVLCAELDSFYSDLAALDEPETLSTETGSLDLHKQDSPKSNSPPPIKFKSKSSTPTVSKDKKKKSKTKTPTIGMKNKSVSKLVAKWKRVQETLDD